MYEWLKNLPLFWGNVLAIIGFLGIIVWTWFRPGSFIFRGAPDRKKWRDLRIWATSLLIIQIILYSIF